MLHLVMFGIGWFSVFVNAGTTYYMWRQYLVKYPRLPFQVRLIGVILGGANLFMAGYNLRFLIGLMPLT